MLRLATRLSICVCVGLACITLHTGRAAAETAPDGHLVEIKKSAQLDERLAQPGVVLVDYFADW